MSHLEERDWSGVPLTELVDHILDEHHTYLRKQLPRLSGLLKKLPELHGEKHPELWECGELFRALRHELEAHMDKEEQVLFPLIHQLEGATVLPESHCGSVRNPIRVMDHEHEVALGALSRLRQLTGDYSPPDDACETYRAALAGLAELEADLHSHIHEESEILFPRTVSAEDSLAPRES